MNRAEYLSQLDKYLKKLPEPDYENAMEYFTEYFEEAGEQRAIEELGTPKEAAEDILKNLLSRNPEKENNTENEGENKTGNKTGNHMKVLVFVLLLFLCVAIIGLSADIKNVFFMNAGRDSGKDSENGTDNGDNEKNNSIHKDSTDSDNVKVWKEDGIRLDSISSIEADLDCIDLAIAVSEDDDFHLSYELHCMNRQNPLSYNLENGVLKLTETDFKDLYMTGVFWSKGNFTYNYCNCITVYVPSDIVLKSCIMNITDSDLTIRELACNTMEIKAADGDISIAGLHASGKVEIITDDGDITISDFTELGGAYIQAFCGDVSISSVAAGEEMQIETEDGDVAITELEVSGKVEIDSDYGDITVRLQKESLPELKITMDTEEGDILVSHSLGGRKSSGHYERDGSDNIYLKGYTEDGDISVQ